MISNHDRPPLLSAPLRLAVLRERAGFTMSRLAAELGYRTPSGLQRYEDPAAYRKPYLPLELVGKLAAILPGKGVPPVTPGEVYALAGVSLGMGVAALSGAATAGPRVPRPAHPLAPSGYLPVRVADIRPGMGGPGEAFGDGSQAETRLFSAAFLDGLQARPADLWVMQVEGPSMSPLLEAGDEVIVDRSRANPSQPGIFVVWDGFGMVCKWVERVAGSQPPRIRLLSENKRFGPYELTVGEAGEGAESYLMGRVVWMSRRL